MRILIVICNFLSVFVWESAAAEVIDIGSRRELFVDYHLIEKLDGARLAMHRPQPREVAIRFGQPWEMHSPGYATVVHDEEKGLYRIFWQ